MINYGCGYCKFRDSIFNWCTKHNKPVSFNCKVKVPSCSDYEHSEDLPDFFCALDEQDLLSKNALLCKDYKSIGDEEVNCSTCEYFRDNLTPDTIIRLL